MSCPNQNQKRVFVLTFETKKGSALDRLYELAVIWHTMQSPLRLMLFLGLLEHLKLRLRALEGQRGASRSNCPAGATPWRREFRSSNKGPAKEVGAFRGRPPCTSRSWCWRHSTTGEHHHGALVQFHATRKPFENVEGDTITFLMRIGLRDPRARPGA